MGLIPYRIIVGFWQNRVGLYHPFHWWFLLLPVLIPDHRSHHPGPRAA